MRRIRVLIVDDSAELRASVGAMLRLDPSVQMVGEAADGEEALRVAGALRPDVVLMDVNMPGLDGIQATERLLAEIKTSVVIISVQGEQAYFRRAMQAGARDFLVKPFSVDELLASIRQAAERVEGDRAEHLGSVITVVAHKGGSGRSLIASNLAVALAQQSRARVALVDLDLEFGVLASLCGVRPRTSIVDLCRVDGVLEPGLVERAMIEVPNVSVDLLSAPPNFEVADEVDGSARRQAGRDYVGEILDALAATHPYVVVDTGSNFREGTLVAMERARRLLAVTRPDIPSLVNAARGVHLLVRQLGYGERLRLVLNESDRLSGLTQADVQRSLEVPIAYFLPSDPEAATWAANAGQPLTFRRGRSRLTEAIATMATDLRSSLDEEAQAAQARGQEMARPGRLAVR